MPTPDLVSSPTTALLTLVNVSATKPHKRRRSLLAATPATRRRLGGRAVDDAAAGSALPPPSAVERLHAKASAAVRAERRGELPAVSGTEAGEADDALEAAQSSDDDDDAAPAGSSAKPAAAADGFEAHFASEGAGCHAELLQARFPNAQDGALPLQWQEEPETKRAALLGATARWARVQDIEEVEAKPHANVLAALAKLRSQAPMTKEQRSLLSCISGYADLLHSRVSHSRRERADMRQVLATHAMSHLTKTRRRILRNNEKLARAASNGTALVAPRDQGFTRPTLLVLAPLRSTAYEWLSTLFALSGCEQNDNQARFEREFGPDPLLDAAAASAGEAAGDHAQIFAGNADDNFRMGVKITRKNWRTFSSWYESDIIVASPLGLRLAIEKDKDADFLSSIEIVIGDQLDIMQMQNWEHVQYVFSHLSAIPKASHDTDFARVRQWYLDGRAPHMRQTLLLAAHDAPEMRALWRGLVNVAGKRRAGVKEEGVMSEVREGIRQNFMRFDCANLNAEADLRFAHFTNKTLPNLLKSAVSAQKTLIFVPSYFDFVRLDAYLRKQDVSFAAISEYSSNKDISRARQAFFSGKKAFLLVTERFHFYRRYVLRGAQTLVFYALPERAAYYPEFLSFPFAPRQARPGAAADEDDEEPELDAADITVLAAYSRYDLMRLQRIVGSAQAQRMVTEEKSNWRFT